LRAHKSGKKLLIVRADLEQLLKADGRSKPTLAKWLQELHRSGLKAQGTAATAADLVRADRRKRSESP
jgi:hypothetical protein